MTARLLGAGLLALAGFMAGVGQLGRLRSRLRLMEDMDAALGLMAAEIEFHARPLPEVFENLYRRGPARTRGFFVLLASDADGLQELWPGAVSRFFGEDGEALLSLGAVLGRFEGDRQAREIEYARQSLRDRAEKIRRETGEKAKNYPALGLCAGAVVGILVI